MLETLQPTAGIYNEWVPGVTPPANDYSINSGHVLPMQVGFPQMEKTIHEWVPGVSTPEGLMLVTGTVAAATSVVLYNSDVFIKIVNTISNTLIIGTTTAIPTTGLVIGTQLITR